MPTLRLPDVRLQVQTVVNARGDAMAMGFSRGWAHGHMKGDVIHQDQRESALHSLFRKCDAAGTLTLRNSNPHGCRRTQARQATGLHRRERRQRGQCQDGQKRKGFQLFLKINSKPRRHRQLKKMHQLFDDRAAKLNAR